MTEHEQLEQVYESVFGDGAINKYTHIELIVRILEMYDRAMIEDDVCGGATLTEVE